MKKNLLIYSLVSAVIICAVGSAIYVRSSMSKILTDPNANLPKTQVANLTAGQPACISVIAFYRKSSEGKTEYFVDKSAETFPYSPTRCSIRIERQSDGTISFTAPIRMMSLGDELKPQDNFSNLDKVDYPTFTQ